jgi:hypothetical protein
MKKYSIITRSSARLFAFVALTMSSAAFSAPWISTPSIVDSGDDISINGGGAPGSSFITLQATNAEGDLVLNIEVFTSSDGSFSYEAALNTSGRLEFTVTANDESASSVSIVQDDD